MGLFRQELACYHSERCQMHKVLRGCAYIVYGVGILALSFALFSRFFVLIGVRNVWEFGWFIQAGSWGNIFVIALVTFLAFVFVRHGRGERP